VIPVNSESGSRASAGIQLRNREGILKLFTKTFKYYKKLIFRHFIKIDNPATGILMMVSKKKQFTTENTELTEINI